MLPVLVRTPRSEYLEACRRAGARPNAGVFAALPDTEAGFHASSLDFTRACIGRNGAGPLAAVLPQFGELRALNVGDNYLSNEGALLICDGVARSKRLEVLSFAGNPVSYPTGKRVEAMLASMPSLTRVDVSGTLMNPGLIKRVHNAAAAKGGSAALPAVAPMRAADLMRPRRADGSLESPPASSEVTAGDGSTSAGPRGGRAASRTAGSSRGQKSPPTVRAVGPEDRWYAMETIWAVAADAVPADAPADGSGYPGLLSVLAHVRAQESAQHGDV
eukprot:CAMPEP_0174853120 /NCGR_PEP_ID=MMETSP1114-20130205/27369_1 /TAXON_ID=312471 /ORGANISM="Neobodo designis, Strain CCAP 1951/1" /LENGTH=274 /DNA_ID=CAMNT_0016087741 /DNA_START=51 /DNA_END=875 /DNA_ORIENTATION=+